VGDRTRDLAAAARICKACRRWTWSDAGVEAVGSAVLIPRQVAQVRISQRPWWTTGGWCSSARTRRRVARRTMPIAVARARPTWTDCRATAVTITRSRSRTATGTTSKAAPCHYQRRQSSPSAPVSPAQRIPSVRTFGVAARDVVPLPVRYAYPSIIIIHLIYDTLK